VNGAFASAKKLMAWWLYDWLMGDRFLIAQARYEDMRIATYDKVFFVKKCAG